MIVTGAGRSGTSAVARVLHESGVRMGQRFVEASEVNPDGFYEDWDVLLLNERMMRDAGMLQRWQPERWPRRATMLAAARRYRGDMAALAAQAPGGWKDPRFSITLEAWLPLLPSKPKVIVCLRSPEAFAESVVRVYGLVDRAEVERQWARHYRRLLAVIRDYRLRATCIEYDALVEQPEETVAALSTFVERPLRAEYIDPPLRRHLRPVPEPYRRLYGRVLQLRSGDFIFPTDPPGQVEVGGHPQSPGPSLSLRAGAAALHLCSPLTAEGYLKGVEQIVARVGAARDEWNTRVTMPKPSANANTRAACETYRSELRQAQRKLAAVQPWPKLEEQHALVVREVNLQRMIAELTLAAISDGVIDRRTMKEAVSAWRRFGRPAVFARAAADRDRELERTRTSELMPSSSAPARSRPARTDRGRPAANRREAGSGRASRGRT